MVGGYLGGSPRTGLAGRAPMPPAARRLAMSASSPRSGGAGVVSDGAGSVSVSLFSALVLSSVVSVGFLAASVVACVRKN